MLHRISAGVIVEDGGRHLFVRHTRVGVYDFWVCPGGGVQEEESLEQAAAREVREETGLEVQVGRLVYIEDLVHPECRLIKFWFLGELIGGALDTSHPEAIREHVVHADWLTREQLADKTVFPAVMTERYWTDRAAGFPSVVRLPLRRMDFW